MWASKEVDKTELQAWLLDVLNAKFAEQEAVIRSILQQPQHLRISSQLLSRDVSGAGTNSFALSEASDLFALPLSSDEANVDTPTTPPIPKVKSGKNLGKHIMAEKLAPDPPFKVFIKRSMDSYMSVVVIINLIFIAAMTEYQAAEADYALGLLEQTWNGVSDLTFEVEEYIFFSIYFWM